MGINGYLCKWLAKKFEVFWITICHREIIGFYSKGNTLNIT